MTREQLERDALALVTGNYWATWRHLRLVLGVHIIGANSLLATLPREVIQQIARLVVAQRPRNCPRFEPLTDAQVVQQGSMWNVSTDEMRRACVISEGGKKLMSFTGALARSMRIPWNPGFHYFELQFFAWSGTTVAIAHHAIQFGVFPEDDDQLALQLMTNQERTMSRHISAWYAPFSGPLSGPNMVSCRMSFLFDFDAGHVLLALNGVVGPRLDLVPQSEILICIEDIDARGPPADADDPVVTDLISAPSRVPMRMADPDLHDHDDPMDLKPAHMGMCPGYGCFCQEEDF